MCECVCVLVTNSRLKETLLKVYSAPLQGTDLTSAHYCHTKKTYHLCSGRSKRRIQLLTVITLNATLPLAPQHCCSGNFIYDVVCDILNHAELGRLSPTSVNK